MRTVFWISSALVVYVYVGYPALLALLARLRPRALAAPAARNEARPYVSIVIAARDEARRLPARISNLRALDYPPARRQIIVVSDGSLDATADVLPDYADVDMVVIERAGKAAALNAGVARARHDLLVFTDARQTFAPDALSELVAPFQDPTVGAVSGELVLDSEPGRRQAERRSALSGSLTRDDRRGGGDRRRAITSTIAEGVGLYWRYEKLIRRSESAVGSLVGATGAIYALRRSLWRPLPPGTILDDVLVPMRAVLAGARVVFAERAHAYDCAPPLAETESRRKVRTLSGNYQLLWLEPRLLSPWHNDLWLQFVSHKLGRLIVPYAMLTLLASNIALAGRSLGYAVALAGQCLFYLLAGYGAWLHDRTAVRALHETQRAATWPAQSSVDAGGAVNV